MVGFLFHYSFQTKVGNDVETGKVVDYVGMDVHEKLGDSPPNDFRDIRRADFVSNERTNMSKAYHTRQKRITGVSPKN